MKYLRYMVAVGGTVMFLTACESIVGSYDLGYQDSPSVEQLEQTPTQGIVISTSQGLLAAWRDGVDDKLRTISHYAREAYYLSNFRTLLDEFDDPVAPGSWVNGMGWSGTYTNIRTINSLLHAVDAVELMSDAEKNAIRGWAITCEAYLLHSQLRVQDDYGIVIDTDRERSEGLAPIATKSEAFTYIIQRYDEASALLANGGSEFPFFLSTGWDGFDTPATFIMVNRALKARAAIEMEDYPTALAALAESFLDTQADLGLGAWSNYSTSPGDNINAYFDPDGFKYLLDTNLVVEAQYNGSNEIDQRVTDKTFPVPYNTYNDVTSNLGNGVHPGAQSPIPVIKNEELILIRAEARWQTNDRQGALDDINVVRTISGNLDPILADPGDQGFEDEILYNRRYSLVFEAGHRWVDLRRFDRLLDFVGPRGPGDKIFLKIPFSADECTQRNFEPTGCETHQGIVTIQ